MKKYQVITLIATALFVNIIFNFNLGNIQYIQQTQVLQTNPELNNQLLSALEDSPLSNENLIQDSEFSNGIISWNYDTDENLTAYYDSTNQQAVFNHSSNEIPGQINSPLTTAYYATKNILNKIVIDNDAKLLLVEYNQPNNIFDVNFSPSLINGSKILIHFASGNGADIYIRETGSRITPIFGEASYSGGNALVEITLFGLSSSRTGFNIDIDFASSTDTANVDYITAITPGGDPKIFNAKAIISQNFESPKLDNSSYNLNFTLGVVNLSGIQNTKFDVKINDTLIFSSLIESTQPKLSYNMQVPRQMMGIEGSFNLFFITSLNISTMMAVNLHISLDSVYLTRSPVLNLLEDSIFLTGIPWQANQSSSQYEGSHLSQNQSYSINSNTTVLTQNGWVQVSQIFNKSIPETDFQLYFTQKTNNMTGIDNIKLIISINETVIPSDITIETINSEFEIYRINVSSIMTLQTIYELKFNFSVTIIESQSVYGWETLLDDVFLLPIWDSELVQFGDYNGNISAGDYIDVRYDWNTTKTEDPIIDGEVFLKNNNTSLEWGWDIGTQSKYYVINYRNGSYLIRILSSGYNVGLYNLSLQFNRFNFMVSPISVIINITGSQSLGIIIEGAYYDPINAIWLINEDNIPYIDDETHKVTILLSDISTNLPISGAFIYAEMAGNRLDFYEIYKITGNPDDEGKYDLYLNTLNLNQVPEYYLFNFSVVLSALGYQPYSLRITTKIYLIPTSITVAPIDPFFEDQEFSLMIMLQDTFHGTSINEAYVTYSIVGYPIQGDLDYIFAGVYGNDIRFTDLKAGNYILNISADSSDYIPTHYEYGITILPKWNITVTVEKPTILYENNNYTFRYSLSYIELEEPLIGESIAFRLFGLNSGITRNYVFVTDGSGFIDLPVMISKEESKIYINLTYIGQFNISRTIYNLELEILQKEILQIDITSSPIISPLLGGSSIILEARITNQTGFGVGGCLLKFTIGTSTMIALSNDQGYATVEMILPNSGSFYIEVEYSGAESIHQTETISNYEIEVLSPEAVEILKQTQIRNLILFGAGILVGGMLFTNYVILKPRQRSRLKDYTNYLQKFDESSNIQLLLIINLKTGVEIYSKAMSNIPIHPTVISGFLQAILSIDASLMSPNGNTSAKQNGLPLPLNRVQNEKIIEEKEQELKFENFRVLMAYGEKIQVALLLQKPPTPKLRTNLHIFINQVEEKLGSVIYEMKGLQLRDNDVADLIEANFYPSLSYNHIINHQNLRIDTLEKWEELIITKVLSREFNGEAYFTNLQQSIISDYPDKGPDILNALLKLRNKKVLIPLSVELMSLKHEIGKSISKISDEFETFKNQINAGQVDRKIVEQIKQYLTECTNNIQEEISNIEDFNIFVINPSTNEITFGIYSIIIYSEIISGAIYTTY